MKKKLLIFSFLILSCWCSCLSQEKKFITHVTLTTYNPTKEQCDNTPLVTANGTKIDTIKLKQNKIKYCAVSRDLLWCLPYGSIIEIEGHGRYKVVDIMHPRFNHYIDILQHQSKKVFKKEKVKVVKIK